MFTLILFFKHTASSIITEPEYMGEIHCVIVTPCYRTTDRWYHWQNAGRRRLRNTVFFSAELANCAIRITPARREKAVGPTLPKACHDVGERANILWSDSVIFRLNRVDFCAFGMTIPTLEQAYHRGKRWRDRFFLSCYLGVR